MGLAQRAKAKGLTAGDKQLAVRCLHLAKAAEKRARTGAAPHKGAAPRKAVITNMKKEATVDHKTVKVQLYRPHGFRAKLAHPKSAMAAAQEKEFGAVDPATISFPAVFYMDFCIANTRALTFEILLQAFVVQQRRPWWKRGAQAPGAPRNSGLSDNMPASIREHLAENNLPWWKTDVHYGFKAKEHKGAKAIEASA